MMIAAAVALLLLAPASTAAAPGESVADLPITEVVATVGTSDTFAVIVSGDGGWVSIDRKIAGVFATRGVPTAGVNALQYFWEKKTPDQAGADLARIVRHYLRAWKKDKVLLIGFSRGADTLPFMASRLPPDLAARVRLVALLAPARETELEFHLADWLRDSRSRTQLAVKPEVEKLTGFEVHCFHGKDEADSLCPDLSATIATPHVFGGGHHFDGQYRSIAKTILDEADLGRTP